MEQSKEKQKEPSPVLRCTPSLVVRYHPLPEINNNMNSKKTLMTMSVRNVARLRLASRPGILEKQPTPAELDEKGRMKAQPQMCSAECICGSALLWVGTVGHASLLGHAWVLACSLLLLLLLGEICLVLHRLLGGHVVGGHLALWWHGASCVLNLCMCVVFG
jgi:hypothetical protein